MTLKIFLLFVMTLLCCSCAKYKFSAQTDGERIVVPLTSVIGDQTLLDEFPCPESLRIQCHESEPPVEICHVTADGVATTKCVARSNVVLHLREQDSNEDFLGKCEGTVVPD